MIDTRRAYEFTGFDIPIAYSRLQEHFIKHLHLLPELRLPYQISRLGLKSDSDIR